MKRALVAAVLMVALVGGTTQARAAPRGSVQSPGTICWFVVNAPVVTQTGYGPVIYIGGAVDCRFKPSLAYGYGLPAPVTGLTLTVRLEEYVGAFSDPWVQVGTTKTYQWTGLVMTKWYSHPAAPCYGAYAAPKFRQYVEVVGVDQFWQPLALQGGGSITKTLAGCRSFL